MFGVARSVPGCRGGAGSGRVRWSRLCARAGGERRRRLRRPEVVGLAVVVAAGGGGGIANGWDNTWLPPDAAATRAQEKGMQAVLGRELEDPQTIRESEQNWRVRVKNCINRRRGGGQQRHGG